eukprot:c27090_g1_i1 orf=493-2634(-)
MDINVRSGRDRDSLRERSMATRISRQARKPVTVAGAAAVVLIAGRLMLRFLKGRRKGNPPGLSFHMDLMPEEIMKLADDLIVKSRKVYDFIAAVPLDKVTYENVIAPLAKLEAEQFVLVQSCRLPGFISTVKEVREASIEADKKLHSHEVECSMRTDVYRVIKAFSEKKVQLGPESQRYVDHLVRDYERLGLHFGHEVRDKVERLKRRLGELCIVYQNNLQEDRTCLYFSEEELAGMPSDYIECLEKRKDGKLKVIVLPRDYELIMCHCKVRPTRSAMVVAFNQRCMRENVPILEKVLELRQQLSCLLGYTCWVNYSLEVCMARNSAQVRNFHAEMLARLTPMAERELEKLRTLKEKDEGDRTIGIEDIQYYICKAEKEELKFDNDRVKEYFPIEVVTSGLLQIYQNLLGVTFKEYEKPFVWHSDVRLFSVIDSDTKLLMGYFYLDLYPRDGKYIYSCVLPLQPSCDLRDGIRQLPAAILLINLPKPMEGRSSLLEHSEVLQYFHEFGHVMHHICSCTSFARFSGFRVEMDFLEAPCQMLENWCYERSSLKMMSGHYKDREKTIPDDICSILQQKRKSYFALNTLLKLIFLGIFDQIVHTVEKADTGTILQKLHPEVILGIPMLDGTNRAASLLHLMEGSHAGVCYGCLWSKVLAADMFVSKFKGSVLNALSGIEYRYKVLAQGASKDATDMLIDFLGREPSVDAYFELMEIR